MAVPTYIIYRDTPAGEPFDPTAAPVFFPPKDSDELFDALRAKFPHVKSHSERMRDAMIEFLIEERQAAQSEQMPITAADLLGVDISTASPFQHSWPSMSSGSTSVFSSPDTLDLATPSFTMSPQIQGPQLSRFPTTTSTTAASPASSNTSPFTSAREGTSPQPLEQMTGVFSVSSSAQPKQRVRRKMTEAEKAEYRKRRIVKACDKCQKRKRKCNHNQPEMDYLAANQKIKKTNKQRSQAQIPKQSSWDAETNDKEFEMNFGFDPSMFGNDMQLFEDDLTLLQEPWSFGQQSQPQQSGMAPAVSRGGRDQQRPMQDFESVFGFDHNTSRMSHESMGMEATTGGRNLQTATSMNSANASNAQLFGQMHNQDQRGQSDQHRNAETIQQQSGGTGNRMLWEHLRTGQTEPTHTSHVHELDDLGLYGLDDSGTLQDTVPPRPSWSRIVLQVTGTLKAIKAFGRLASSPNARTALQSVSMSNAAAFISIRNSQEVNAQQWRSVHMSRAVRDASLLSTLATKKVFHPACASALAGAPLSWASRDGSQDGLRLEVEALLNTTHDRLLHGSVSAAATSASSRSSEDLASTSAPVSRSGSLFEKESDSAHNQGRPDWATIGEGIDRLPSPSTEMFMLRRRIPNALHSIVDRNNYQHNAFATASPIVHTHVAVSALSGHNDDPEHNAGGRSDPSTGSKAIVGPWSGVGASDKATTRGSRSNCDDITASFQSYAQDRLSDHVTYRDHFGRSTNALAVLAGALLLASLLFQQIQAVSPSLLLLALALPDSDWRHWSTCLFRPVQCTTKNSSWLGSFLVRSSSRSKYEYISKGPVEDRGGRGCVMWC